MKLLLTMNESLVAKTY